MNPSDFSVNFILKVPAKPECVLFASLEIRSLRLSHLAHQVKELFSCHGE